MLTFIAKLVGPNLPLLKLEFVCVLFSLGLRQNWSFTYL